MAKLQERKTRTVEFVIEKSKKPKGQDIILLIENCSSGENIEKGRKSKGRGFLSSFISVYFFNLENNNQKKGKPKKRTLNHGVLAAKRK